MSRNRKSSGSKPGYTVGYGRPPLSSRFKPGTSGNAKGRPKNSKNLKTLIRQAFTAKISIREGSSNRRVSKIEGVVLRQLESALKGQDRAAMAVVKMAMQMGFLEDAQPETAETVTTTDEEIMQQLLAIQKRRGR